MAEGAGTKILFKSPRAGSHDIAMDPLNPAVLYAPIWQAQRFPHALVSGGEECGLWRSFDGGDSWQEISRKPGLPNGMLGKIGVAVSQQPVGGSGWGRSWALVEAEDGALFRSDDGGETWDRASEFSGLRTRPWYYMHVTADPVDPDTVYVQNYRLWKSIDAGRTFLQVPTPHGDDHALWIDPTNPRRMIEGNDGGACVSFNGGQSWSSIYNQPTAQLYHVTTDDAFPYRVYASQQDNTAISIPSASPIGAITERDWVKPGGGESGYIAIKPDDNAFVVASGPAGRRFTNDVMYLHDRRTEQDWQNTVWPELYGWGLGGEGLRYRFNWTFPIHFSRHDPDVLWVASQFLHRSTDRGASWEAISDDLTRADPSKLGPSGGPITRDNTGAEVYCTIFALAELPHCRDRLWVGTDDGLVHRSYDGGRTWRNITPDGRNAKVTGEDALPEWALISIVEPSPHDADTLYVAATRYKHDDTRPYLYKTADGGMTWRKITSGLPDNEFTRAIREDPRRRGLLYCGTETGIYVSLDDGARWHRLGGNLPIVPIYDLIVRDAEMVVATHGRSIWILDDVTPFHVLQDRAVDGASSTQDSPILFPPRPTTRMRISGGYGGVAAQASASRGPAWPGMISYARTGASIIRVLPVRQPDGDYDVKYLDSGENPPNGVVIHYYLPRAPQEALSLTLLDADGTELRRFTAGDDRVPAAAGLNRFLWNRRLPGAPKVLAADLEPVGRPDGPLVLPGRYAVRLTLGTYAETHALDILPDPRVGTSGEELERQLELLRAIVERLSTVNDMINAVDAWREQIVVLDRRLATSEAPFVRERLDTVGAELAAIRGELIDVRYTEAQLWPTGLHEKLNALFDAVDSADRAPARQMQELFDLLCAQLDALLRRWRSLEERLLPELNKAMNLANLAPLGAASRKETSC